MLHTVCASEGLYGCFRHDGVHVIQDWLALSEKYYTRPAHEETINDPTNPRHYWRYRMAHHLEDLLEDKELLLMIQNKNLLSGRAHTDEVFLPDEVA